MLGVEMTSATHQTEQERDLLSAVALLIDLPERGLVRGQVGTIVDRSTEQPRSWSSATTRDAGMRLSRARATPC
jgi:hypothetical protein